MIKLYKSLVRPHLEYAVQAWTTYLQKDIKRLGGEQRMAIKLVPSRRDVTNNMKLDFEKYSYFH